MGAFSVWHLVIAAGVAVLLFGGGGKIPALFGDVAQGMKAFRNGLKDDDTHDPSGRA